MVVACRNLSFIIGFIIIIITIVVSSCGWLAVSCRHHQSPSRSSLKCPRTSRAVANCKTICDNDECSNSSLVGNGGSHLGLICLP